MRRLARPSPATSGVTCPHPTHTTTIPTPSPPPPSRYWHRKDASLLHLLPAPSETPSLLAYGVEKGELFSVRLDQAKGTASDVTSLRGGVNAAPASGPAAVATLDRKHLLLLDRDSRKLLVHAVGSSKLAAHTYEPPELGKGATLALSPASLPAMALLAQSTGGSLLLSLGKDGAKLERTVAASDHAWCHTASKEGKAVLGLAQVEKGALQFHALPIEADGAHEAWPAATALPYDPAAHGGLGLAFLNSYSRKDGSMGHRLLLSGSDASLQLLQAGGAAETGKQGWVREEALATVRHVEALPFPSLAVEGDSAAGAAGADAARPTFAFAVPALIKSLRARWEEAKAAAGVAAGPPPTHADAYGFRQAMVATTRAGKVFGLHSSDGSPLWSSRISPLTASDLPPGLPYLLLCRGGLAAEAVVVAQDAARWHVHALSPFTGAHQGASPAMQGEGRIVHAAKLLPLAAEGGRPPVMLVDDALRVHLYPDTAEHRAALRRAAGDILFHLHSEEEGTLRGYSVGLADAGAAPGAESFVGLERWSLALPAGENGERGEVSTSSFPHEAAVHSPVRALGDRSVLHKYINRNLLAVGVALPAQGDFTSCSLHVLLVDTVTGRVVHSVTHEGGKAPLTLLLGESWLVYHYWASKSLSYQFAVTELFRNSTTPDDPLSLLLGGTVDYSLRENKFDGHTTPMPHSLSQGYAFGAPAAALAVTQTMKGITPKTLLLATASGSLMLLDKRFLDPRRPMVPGGPSKMSAADREEGLMPYGPSLGGVQPLAVASHRHALARPTTIVSAPTTLESTSLALVIGLDLYGSRVSPAKDFDRLNEDFNFVALVGAILLMTAATLGSGWYTTRQDLKRAWK